VKKSIVLSIFVFVMLLSTAPIGSALYSSVTPWSMYRYNLGHSGATPSDAPSSNNTLWAHGFSTYGLSTTTTPLIVDGRVIFAVRDLAIAVDETTGVELWRHQTNGVLTASTSANGRVFYGLSEGTGGIICINATTGEEIWNQDLSPNYVMNSPLVSKGIVYAGSTGNYTYAFEAATGHYKWGYKTGGPVYSSPAADGDFLFFGCDDTKLYALNVTGLTPVSLWNFTSNGAIRSTPAISYDRIFFGSDNNRLYALNETTGELIWSWTTATSTRIRNGVAVANNIVYVTPESTSGYTADMGKIYALRADVAPGNYSEGDLVIRYWIKQFVGYLFNEPVYANGAIIVTSAGGDPAKLYALDADVGTTLWYRNIKWWPSLGNAVVADGRVWFSAYWWDPGSFTLYCIGDPFPPSTTHYIVNAGGQDFDVTLETNSTVKDFNTTVLETQGRISFDVQGIGTTGMCNITIPNDMLDGTLNVTVDGEPPLNLIQTTNDGTISLYFTYNSSQHAIEITGTNYIPEFSTFALLPLLTTILLAMVIQLKRKHLS
jgi:outer membrane protein assembly factor BamB